MTTGADDPRLPRLLSLSGHELSNAISVALGYIRFLSSERGGPVNEQQRKWLDEVYRACGRVAVITDDIRELGKLEARSVPFNLTDVDLRTVLSESTGNLPPVPDREITVTVVTGNEPAMVKADKKRLTNAFASIISALRRELVTTSELQVRQKVGTHEGRPVAWVAIGGADLIDAMASADPALLSPFDEWRGGNGMTLPLARRVVNAHDGLIWSPPADGMPGDGSPGRPKTGAVVALPLSTR